MSVSDAGADPASSTIEGLIQVRRDVDDEEESVRVAPPAKSIAADNDNYPVDVRLAA